MAKRLTAREIEIQSQLLRQHPNKRVAFEQFLQIGRQAGISVSQAEPVGVDPPMDDPDSE